jgi:transposase
VSRKRLKDYRIADGHESPVVMEDSRRRRIEIQAVEMEGETDCFFHIRSHAKGLKEASMETRFTQCFEKGLEQIALSLEKKGGVKRLEKVWERIGRLKQKYPSVNRLYEIQVESKTEGRATDLVWKRTPARVGSTHGVYFVRTTLPQAEERTTWQIYNTIREIEATYRCLKTDLQLRPVFHKTDAATMAHLHLGLPAYQLVSTIRFQLKQKGICSNWREIVRMMNTQKLLTTSVRNTDDEIISIRQCTEPQENVRLIYDALGYECKPFIRKKSVVPQTTPEKNQGHLQQKLTQT